MVKKSIVVLISVRIIISNFNIPYFHVRIFEEMIETLKYSLV